MTVQKLLLASAAVIAVCGSGFANTAPAHDAMRWASSKGLVQVGDDGLPASSEEIAQRDEQPRDMSPQTDLGARRTAQTEKPGDQRMTTPLPPTTGTETKAVALSQIDQPDQTLKKVRVETKDGQTIGEVAQVTLDATGKAQEVVLNDGYGTRLAATVLVYDVERGVLIAQLPPFDQAPQSTTPPSE